SRAEPGVGVSGRRAARAAASVLAAGCRDTWQRRVTLGPVWQELRSREEELMRAALQQKSQEEQLKRREQQLAEREIHVLERELNILIFQLNQEKPKVKKRKGKFKRSRLKLKDGRRISLPSVLIVFLHPTDFQHKITVQASPTLDKRRSLNSGSSSPPSSPTVIPRLRAIQHFSFVSQYSLNGCFLTVKWCYRVCLYLCSGVSEEPKPAPDGLEPRKPKQIKSPSQACIDLPLWKEGQRENPVEPESREEGTPGSPATGTPQGTPPNSLSRCPPRKKTESALYSCTVLLASVALGLDLRELQKTRAGEEPLPKEERKRREGIFQWAPKSRSPTSPPSRLPGTGEGAGSCPSLPPSSALGLLAVPSLSTKCLLQTDGEDSFEGSAHIPRDPEMRTPDLCPAFGGRGPEPTSVPRLEANRGVWENLPPSFLEPTCGDVPSSASSKERAVRHRRTRSDGSAFQTSGRLHQWVRGRNTTVETRM
ncbi:Mitogen-activated protein kinase kinase kinase 21, partial [Camelus dromedarius]